MANAAPSAPRLREATAPAAAGSAPPASSLPAVDVTAITTRDDFLLELGQTLGGQAAVRPVESIDAALPHLSSKRRAQVLVIDARDVTELRAAADAAHAEAPHAVVLVFTESAAEGHTGSALKGSRVFAVLPLPVDARKTQAVFEGAVADAQQRKDDAPTDEVQAPNLNIGAFRPAPATDAAASDDGGAGDKRKLIMIGGAAAATVALAAVAWLLHSKAAPPTAATPSVPAASIANSAAPAAAPDSTAAAEPAVAVADTSILKGKVDDLLEKARLAMHERRYTEPTGDNALLYFRSASAADASNGEARDGLQRVAGVLAGRFDEALSAGRFDEAALTLANFRAAAPTDARVGPFTQRLAVAQVSRAIADGNFERAAALVRQAQQSGLVPAEQISRWRAELARHQEDSKVQHLVTLVAERIRDGKLTDADDSARSYVQQLTTLAPGSPATARANHDLIGAYLHKARDAAIAKNAADQDHWINAARDAGMKPAEISVFMRDLSNTRQKASAAEGERLVQSFRERLGSGALTDPAQDSAAYYLTQLQTNSPNDPALVQGSRDLAGKLLERARAAVLAGKSGDADLAAARRWGADAASINAVTQLGQSKAQAPAINAAALATQLKQTRAANPEYPENALNRRISGSVLLTYTVDTSGVTRDVHVIEATPPGVFDNAAVSAVRRWRYAPMVVNGVPVEVPVKTQMRFELPK
ncbi:MAG: TonB family protein [Steroidobacterales bacterium]